MGITSARCLGTGRLLLALLTAWVVGCGLAACANNLAGAGSGPKADIVTESDEPAARRRARIRLELAAGYFEEGKTTIALDEVKQALAADPNFAEAYNVRGLIYMRLKDPALAEESFRRALALKPGDANVYHNYGWLLCQQGRYPESMRMFAQAIDNPQYGDSPKTLMTEGLCQIRAGNLAEAEASLARSYELDAGNPITGYNLSLLLFKRGELVRAQFYIRRLNNSDLANAQSLWLGIKIERKLNNREAVQQLAGQLRKRFPQSPELASYDKGAFDE